MTDWRCRRAVATLRSGGIVAYPTESVYGIGCDPWNRAAVARVFAVKRRPVRKRCILIASDPGQLDPLVDVRAPDFSRFASRYWPGPVTLVAPARGGAPAWLVGADGTLAMRVTSHPVARDLCASFRGPLISTSANRAGPSSRPRCVAGPRRVRRRDRLVRRRTSGGAGCAHPNRRPP